MMHFRETTSEIEPSAKLAASLGEAVHAAEQLLKRIREEGAEAFRSDSYDKVAGLRELAVSMTSFGAEIEALNARWARELEPMLSRQAGTVTSPDGQDGICLTMDYGDAHARAHFRNGRMNVLSGSTLITDNKISMPERQSKLKKACQIDGRLVRSGQFGTLKMTQDMEFSSASAAAAFIGGCSLNGKREWRVLDQGAALGDWLETAVQH